MNKLLNKLLNKETIIYVIFGILTTIVDFVAFGILYYTFNIGEIISNTTAWVLAVAFAFITNKLFVFESKSFQSKKLIKEIISFVSSRVITLLLTNLFLLCARFLGTNMMFAKALISVVVIILNYVFSKLFVFKENTNQSITTKKDYLEENTMDATPAISDKLKFRIGYALSFLIPVIILVGIFIGRKVFPFGDEIYLRSDCYHQYAPFHKELYRKLTEGGSLLYSWNIGMGVNFTALYSYYLASPVNLLLGLIAPTGNVLIAIDIFIIIKTGLCGLTCGYYLHKRYGGKNLSFAAIAVFYALSSYMAAFSWNIMWLDCLVLLPLIVLGMDKIIKENKYFLYTIALGLSIFSNYYISIMICIFLVFYFIVRMLSTCPTEGFIKYTFSRVKSFVIGSLIAGGLGACMILPEIAALSYTVSGEFKFPEQWQNYFSIIEMISRSMMNVEVSIFNAHEPNVYCTVGIFMFLPMYFLCKKINIKEKYGTGFLIGLFLISFNTNIPNYLFHGMHFPNSLPARESFIYIFVLVTVVYQVIVNIDCFTKKQIAGSFFGGLGVMLLIEELYVNDTYTFDIIYMSMLFLVFYFIVTMALRNKKINKTFIVYVLFIVCIAEATINSDHEKSYSTTTYSAYLEDNKAIENLVNKIEDNSFYRIEKLNRKTKNDAAWNNYYGVSIFSSTANGNFTEFLGRLGFEKSTNAYSYYGSTPFTSALLSVKYVLSNNLIETPYLMSLYNYDEEASRYLYKLDYTLPLGFMIPSDFSDNWLCEGNNPFAVQNSFVESSTGYVDMFTQVYAGCKGSYTVIEPTEDCDLYVYVTNYVDNISWDIENADGTSGDQGSASGLNHRQIVHIGDVTAGSKITVSSGDAVSSLQLYAYAFHQDVFDIAFNALSSQGLQISEFEDTYIKGSINAKEDGLMYTSIIYDRGWKAYIDGKEVEISSINEALLAIPVPAGTHTIELKYCPENLVSGLVITIISIGLLTFLIIWDKKKKKAVADDTTEETDEIDELDDNTDESIIESENEAIEEANAPNKENE
ncbi:MAG: YfhO family protein [Lachnospiraceae bacterium]|nr:YfhO family protein [Lachnospiraceae bacterium]